MNNMENAAILKCKILFQWFENYTMYLNNENETEFSSNATVFSGVICKMLRGIASCFKLLQSFWTFLQNAMTVVMRKFYAILWETLFIKKTHLVCEVCKCSGRIIIPCDKSGRTCFAS